MHLYARVEAPWFALGFVAFVPWLAALDAAGSARRAAALGLGFSVAFVLAVFPWFASGMARYAGAPLGAGVLVLVLAAPLLQPQLPLYALARHALRARAGARASAPALGAALAYVGLEWALPKLFGDTLGHGLLAAPRLRQAADLAGAGGLTLALLLANEGALAALRALAARGPAAARLRAALAPAALALGLAAALAAYGALRLRSLEAALAQAPRVRVALVQADIARYGELRSELGTGAALATILDAHLELTGEAFARGRPDLVIWPETVYPTTFGLPKSEEGAAFDQLIARLVGASGIPLVFGAYDAEGAREFNAAVFLEADGDGRVGYDTYRKAALFPLTERVPAWLDPLRGAAPWLGSWEPGDGPKPMAVELPGGRALRVAPLICYDAVVPRLAREAVRQGAELIVTLSNDSWFPGGAHLHLAVSAFRSLETRRAQARATNTGISALILPTGEIAARAELGERTALAGELPLVAQGDTLALARGDWLGPAALAGAALLAFRRRSQDASFPRR
jgi:apolipoprotein N-acyltransferase